MLKFWEKRPILDNDRSKKYIDHPVSYFRFIAVFILRIRKKFLNLRNVMLLVVWIYSRQLCNKKGKMLSSFAK